MVIDFTVEKNEEAATLGAFLRSRGVSFGLLKRIKFLPDGIAVDGQKQNTNYKLTMGQKVTIDVSDRPQEIARSIVVPQDIPMDIVYEDFCCMVVNKPYGMAIHPSMDYGLGTLANAFCGYWKAKGQEKTYRALNRLDKNTSGLVMIALDAFSAQKLKNKVDKVYTAIVEGKIEEFHGFIEGKIARVEGSIITRCVGENGQDAKTEYNVIKCSDEFSLVDIKLHTGRTHQIRVHFAYIGHPLAGDDMYGGKRTSISRHALHCKEMEFISPENGAKVSIKSQIPKDMADIVMKI